MKDRTETIYDIAIVGAGMVGSTLACQLIANNPSLRIVVVEAREFSAGYSETVFDPRVVALTSASRRLFDDIDVWSDIEKKRCCFYKQMHVWDGNGTGKIDFDCQEVAEEALGVIVENSIIVEALLEKLKQTSVKLLCPASVSAIHLSPENEVSQLLLEGGNTIHASLIVATDGANSKIRQLANIDTREWSYGHTAIVCTVETEISHQFVARQCFTQHGPLAFLPLLDNKGGSQYCSIVWSVQSDYANTLLAMSDAEFSDTLANAFEYKLGKVLSVTERHSFPLRQRHCKDYFKPGLVVAGDAAHTIHPLAGQGVNLGLQDVAVLAEEIERAIDRGLPLSDVSILQRYQRRRKGPNLAMMGVMEGFKQLFSQEGLPLKWLRNEGMKQLNKVEFVKKQIIKEAMGL